MSGFSIKHWMKKGYTEDEAKYQVAIRRPTNYLYFVNKGHSEEEAKRLVIEHQTKTAERSAARSIEDKRKSSNMCIEYYLERGYSKEEAAKLRSERQTTFSLDKCIERFGEQEGKQIWQARQDKWQDTLSSKTEEELNEINERKKYWQYKSAEDLRDIRQRAGESYTKFYKELTVEQKREDGKRRSKYMIKAGLATPVEDRDAFAEYRNQVDRETNRHNLTLLENYDKRSKYGYSLDHKYSVFQGFVDGISAEIVGHICNLEMLPYSENSAKRHLCSHTLEELLEKIKQYNDKT